MNYKEKNILIDFLNDYSESLGNKGCNDWSFPDAWSIQDKNQFVEEYHAMNGDPEEYEYSENPNISDFCAVALLSHKIFESLEYEPIY